ncbi:MAG TPA: hypothetical protein VF691_11395 [Cytophagaceae bacterium]
MTHWITPQISGSFLRWSRLGRPLPQKSAEGRAIHFYSSLVPRCGVSVSITPANSDKSYTFLLFSKFRSTNIRFFDTVIFESLDNGKKEL